MDAKLTIHQLPYVAGATNAHGNNKPGYGAQVARQVYGYAPPARTQESEPGRTLVIVGLEVYAPVFPVNNRDRFIIEGSTYEVEGDPSIWDKGPFGFTPGQTFRLQKVEGAR